MEKKKIDSGTRFMDIIAYLLITLLLGLYLGKMIVTESSLDRGIAFVGAMLCVYILFKFSPWNEMWWGR